LLLDTWQRSGLPAGDFAAMVGISKHTLYTWKWKFEEQGQGAGSIGRAAEPRGERCRNDQAHYPDAQTGQPGLGLPADQRPVAGWVNSRQRAVIDYLRGAYSRKSSARSAPLECLAAQHLVG